MVGEIRQGLAAASAIPAALTAQFQNGAPADSFKAVVQAEHDSEKGFFKRKATHEKEKLALRALITLIDEIKACSDKQQLTLRELEIFKARYSIQLQHLPKAIKKQWQALLKALQIGLIRQYQAFYNSDVFTLASDEPVDLSKKDPWAGITSLPTRIALADSLRISDPGLLVTIARRQQEIRLEGKGFFDSTTKKRDLKIKYDASVQTWSQQASLTLNKLKELFTSKEEKSLFTSSWRRHDTAKGLSAAVEDQLIVSQVAFMTQVRLASVTDMFKLDEATALELHRLHEKAREGSPAKQLLGAFILRQEASAEQPDLYFRDVDLFDKKPTRDALTKGGLTEEQAGASLSQATGFKSIQALGKDNAAAFSDPKVAKLVDKINRQYLEWKASQDGDEFRAERAVAKSAKKENVGTSVPAAERVDITLLTSIQSACCLTEADNAALLALKDGPMTKGSTTDRVEEKSLFKRVLGQDSDFSEDPNYPCFEEGSDKQVRAAQNAVALINEIIAASENKTLTTAKLHQLIQQHFFIHDLPTGVLGLFNNVRKDLYNELARIEKVLHAQMTSALRKIPAADISSSRLRALPPHARVAVKQAAYLNPDLVARFQAEEARLLALSTAQQGKLRNTAKKAAYVALVNY